VALVEQESLRGRPLGVSHDQGHLRTKPRTINGHWTTEAHRKRTRHHSFTSLFIAQAWRPTLMWFSAVFAALRARRRRPAPLHRAHRRTTYWWTAQRAHSSCARRASRKSQWSFLPGTGVCSATISDPYRSIDVSMMGITNPPREAGTKLPESASQSLWSPSSVTRAAKRLHPPYPIIVMAVTKLARRLPSPKRALTRYCFPQFDILRTSRMRWSNQSMNPRIENVLSRPNLTSNMLNSGRGIAPILIPSMTFAIVQFIPWPWEDSSHPVKTLHTQCQHRYFSPSQPQAVRDHQ